MPMTQDEVISGEMVGPVGPRKLYLIPGKIMGTHLPQTLVALDERELEEYRQVYTLIIELGTAHPDLAEGVEWEVYNIRRRDIANLPRNPLGKKGTDEVDSGLQHG